MVMNVSPIQEIPLRLYNHDCFKFNLLWILPGAPGYWRVIFLLLRWLVIIILPVSAAVFHELQH